MYLLLEIILRGGVNQYLQLNNFSIPNQHYIHYFSEANLRMYATVIKETNVYPNNL